MAEKQKMEERTRFDGKKVEILGETYEEGKPESPHRWRDKLKDREEMLKYLESAERYWSDTEAFGSEKRKKPA